ncbi:MAG: biopolymer transporter ExbD [Planctomycetia bacterium]|nr:biopolymer transporter ExbD [Planctomycetia bacterium]
MRIQPHAGTPPRRRMNMTPLIDVVFLLLIFFMVTTTFRTEVKLFDLLLPRSEKPNLASTADTVSVTIDADGTYYIGANEEKVTPKELRAKLTKAKGDREIMMIVADKRTDFENIMRLIDLAKDLGLEKVVFMTEKSDSPETAGN